MKFPKNSRAKYAQVRVELGFLSGHVVQQSTSQVGISNRKERPGMES